MRSFETPVIWKFDLCYLNWIEWVWTRLGLSYNIQVDKRRMDMDMDICYGALCVLYTVNNICGKNRRINFGRLDWLGPLRPVPYDRRREENSGSSRMGPPACPPIRKGHKNQRLSNDTPSSSIIRVKDMNPDSGRRASCSLYGSGRC